MQAKIKRNKKETENHVYLAREFIITHIVRMQMQEADIIEYSVLESFANYDLNMDDVMNAVDEMEKEHFIEKIASDKGTSIKLTEKGYRVFNKAI
jgi:CTP-dependent riboflavin kinase